MAQKRTGGTKVVAQQLGNKKHADDQAPDSEERASGKIEPKEFPWGALAKGFAGIAAVGGVILHLMGYVSHQAYLETWGIDPGLFPKPTDATVINGYYAFVDRAAALLSAARQGATHFLLAAVIVALYIFILSRIGKLSTSGKLRALVRRTPDWLSDLAKSLVLTLTMLGGIPIALVLAAFVLAVPAILGQNFGQSIAKKEMTVYRDGCNAEGNSRMCVELRKDGKTIARGFLIESSESHVALFDVSEKRARALSRDGMELLVDSRWTVPRENEIEAPAQPK